MDAFNNYLENPTAFITLDANSGRWKVDVDKADHDMPAFMSRHTNYSFERRQFSL